jgi:hypothetical protein
MTAELQPLDAEIFGQLKSAGSKLWVEKYLFDPSQHFTKADASLSLQNCWKKLDSTKIRSAWKRVFDNANALLCGFIAVPTKFEDDTSSEPESDSDSDYKEAEQIPKKRTK